MFNSILIPLEQSKEAIETVKAAIQIAQNHQSNIIILSIIKPKGSKMKNDEVVVSLLTRICKQVGKDGIHFKILKKQGNPDFVIPNVAVELNIDLIVMSNKGSPSNSEQENTTTQVIRLAPCPVFVMP